MDTRAGRWWSISMTNKHPERSDEEGETGPEMGMDHLTVTVDPPEDTDDEDD